MDVNCHNLMGGPCFEHTWAVSTSLFNAFSSPNLCLRGFHVAFPIQPAGHSAPAKVPWLRGLRSPYRLFWIVVEIAAVPGLFRFAGVQQPEHWWETFLKIWGPFNQECSLDIWVELSEVHNVKRKGRIVIFKILLKFTVVCCLASPNQRPKRSQTFYYF